MSTRFSKYEGLGNDFVIVEPDPGSVEEVMQRAPGWCDRHFGIGADGVLVLAPPSNARARTRMMVVNRDGSRPEMCGNGLRCVALHLARVDGSDSASYDVETDSGLLRCSVNRVGDAGWVEVELGQAELRGNYEHTFQGHTYAFALVSMGNPHAVALDVRLSVDEIDAFGPQVSQALPGGSNVEFVQGTPTGRFDSVVWERGVGRTLACGTGAAATAVALAVARRAPFNQPIALHLPGGDLEVTVTEELRVSQKGPARRVFEGETL